ncbi:hypothetical protein WMY93_001965 [Mugilogobius chulae]|uniref:Uncharacterized protein n=1 Tax=Mugilogobius chulae TaxID=88201 RepID=A0AAW0Q3C4_9GOBI
MAPIDLTLTPHQKQLPPRLTHASSFQVAPLDLRSTPFGDRPYWNSPAPYQLNSPSRKSSPPMARPLPIDLTSPELLHISFSPEPAARDVPPPRWGGSPRDTS